MISLFRGFLNTWAARAFFLVLVAAFALWGIGDVIRSSGVGTSLATVGDERIEPAAFQEAYRRQLAQVTQMMGGRAEPSPAIRRTVAEQSLDRLIVQAAIGEEVHRLGIVVPDAALRQAVFDIPAFRGPAGAFDRGVFDQVMRNNNLTEGRFLELLRSDLAQRQLIETVQAGIGTPDVLLRRVFAFQNEKRVGEVVDFPFSAAAAPPAPSDEDLQRQYENNPTVYSDPAFRRIKLVVLSAQTLARGVAVSPEQVSAYYDAHKADYVSPEKRAAEVITVPDEAGAKRLAAAWQAGADWAAMQDAAKGAAGSAVDVALSERDQFPSPDLGAAVFGAAADTITAPLQTPFGWQVLRVTKVEPGSSRTLDQVRDQIRQKVAEDGALDQVYDRANKLDDALSSGTSLDDLPTDLGLSAVTGTLDQAGDTPEGKPAPIPGPPPLRDAIVKTAFATVPGDKPRMVEGPGQSYYALDVEELIPSKLKPFAEVAQSVREDWERDERRREQNVAAAKLMADAESRKSLDDAATVAGVRLEKTPPVPRTGETEGVAAPVQEALFRLAPGETTMVETPDGFDVVRLAQVVAPDAAADPAGAEQVKKALTASLDQDVEITFALALRDRAKPQVNRALFDSLAE